MKKNNFIFVIFLILIVPILIFASCDNGTNTPQVPENPNTPPVDTDGEDDKENDKTQDEEKDEVINHLVGEWIMDELFITCKINEDKSFETIVEIDEDTTQNYEGSYVLGKDGKSATATVNNVPTENDTTTTATVTMKMLEGESDVFSMDLTAFNLGNACTFVKKQSTTPDFVGTWSNEWWDILIDETNYAVIGREPVGEYAGVTTSKGEIAIFANTITLTQTEFPEMLIATGVMSTNGKSYVHYYYQTSSAPGTWKSDVFTRTSTEIPEMPEDNSILDKIEYIGEIYKDITPSNVESKITEIVESGATEATLFLRDFTNDDVVNGSVLKSAISNYEEQLNVFLVFSNVDNPNLNTIGSYALSGCGNIVGVYFSENVKVIENSAFLAATKLKYVTLSKGCQIIENNAFYNTCIENIILPETLTTIERAAFLNTEISSIFIPASVISIGEGPFASGKLREILISEDNKSYKVIDNVLYTNDSKTIIQYPSLKEDINYTILDSVERIGEYAFYKNTFLTSVTLPSELKSIGYSAFGYCEKIEFLEVPDSVNSIEGYAFSYMSALERIELPEILDKLGNGTFSNCSSLKSVSIPAGGTEILRFTCTGCSSLESVKIPDGIKELPNTFTGCASLISVIIPDSVINLNCTFLNCKSLTDVIIGENVELIEESAFLGCDSLSSVIFKNTTQFYCASKIEDAKQFKNGEYVSVTDPELNAKNLSLLYEDGNFYHVIDTWFREL